MPADPSSLADAPSARAAPYSIPRGGKGKALAMPDIPVDDEPGPPIPAPAVEFPVDPSMIDVPMPMSAPAPVVLPVGSTGTTFADAGAGDGEAPVKIKKTIARRHVSCEQCRMKKMKCSRSYPCASCKMRGDECVWKGGATPNGAADQNELEASQTEIARLNKLVELLTARVRAEEHPNASAADLSATVASGSAVEASSAAFQLPSSSAVGPHTDDFSFLQENWPGPQASGSGATQTA